VLFSKPVTAETAELTQSYDLESNHVDGAKLPAERTACVSVFLQKESVRWSSAI